MIHPFRIRRRFQSPVSAAVASFFAAVLLLSAAIPAAPLFSVSGKTAELQRLVLAQDSGGPVTALDVLFYLDLTRNPAANSQPKDWLAGDAERTPAFAKSLKDCIEEYLAVRALKREGPAPEVPDFVRRSHLYSAAEAAWVENMILKRNEIQITDTDINRYYIAHPEKYASDSRAEVRYIFLPVADLSQPALVREGEDQLNQIREQIAKGQITFAEAARRYSQAPSANNGGLIPTFASGAHFTEFDYQTFAIKIPSEMSPVFVGNDGVYLIQLLSQTAPSKIPVSQVKEPIRKVLEDELVSSYYRFLLKKLTDRQYSQNMSALWAADYSDTSAPIAFISDRKLTRDQLMRINPGVINAKYEPQWSIIQKETGEWLEGEIILADLQKNGLGDHPYLAQAERIGEELAAANMALAHRVPWSGVATPDAAVRTLNLSDEITTHGIRQSRVIEITIAPEAEVMKDPARADVTRATVRMLGEKIGQGQLPTRPDATDFAAPLKEAAAKGDPALAAEIKKLRGAIELSPWTDIRIRIDDLEWKDSAPVVAWNPALTSLPIGGISPPQPLGEQASYLFVAGMRLDTKSEWLEIPVILQSIAYQHLKSELLKQEVTKIQSQNLITIDLGKQP